MKEVSMKSVWISRLLRGAADDSPDYATLGATLSVPTEIDGRSLHIGLVSASAMVTVSLLSSDIQSLSLPYLAWSSLKVATLSLKNRSTKITFRSLLSMQ